ncbi:YqzG/YhdC family protein [Cohnella yongneupensis]|uniref:YqzG/YhdC family protein n=1 Tax=Cohnella yongneupensis TaxID=425006 RepID=A0ABW0QU18_9BACL
MFSAIRNGILILGLLFGACGSVNSMTASAAIQPPEYAKWGRIAMQVTIERYHLPIVDYLHVGRRQLSPGIAEEKFKLWLRSNTREFGVFVTIRFETSSDRILAIEFEETSR